MSPDVFLAMTGAIFGFGGENVIERELNPERLVQLSRTSNNQRIDRLLKSIVDERASASSIVYSPQKGHTSQVLCCYVLVLLKTTADQVFPSRPHSAVHDRKLDGDATSFPKC